MATRNYNPFRDDPDALWNYGLRIDDYKPKPQEPAPKDPQSNNPQPQDLEFRIINKNNSWLINGVKVYGQKDLLQVELSKKLLDGGAAKSQSEWITHAKVADKRGAYRTPSAPLQSGLPMTLYEHRNDKELKKDVESIRSFLQKQYQSHWLWTLSQVEYQPNGKDTIMHDVGLPSERVSQYDVKGARGLVTKLSSAADTALQSIFGISDIDTAQELGNWLTKKPTNLWRWNHNEEITTPKCGVAVDCDNVGFDLYGDYHFGDRRPSLGVLVVGAKNFHRK